MFVHIHTCICTGINNVLRDIVNAYKCVFIYVYSYIFIMCLRLQ